MQSGELNRYLLVCLLVFTRASIVYVKGDYIVEVRTHSYTNPTNRCAECAFGGPNRGCCDDFSETQCTGELRCDNYFYYCLRALGSSGSGCSGGVTSTQAEPDGGTIDFTQTVVLGLANPLPLSGISDTWNGIQLFIEVDDSDPGPRNDELVDRILFDIPPSAVTVGVETNTFTFNGTFGFSTIQLSVRVVCEINYFGPDCSDFCDTSESTCTCAAGFSGEFCAINIDDCEGITCSDNGVCVDGINSFQCDCEVGFTGTQCEINIDDCNGADCSGNGQCSDGINSFTCTCDPGFTGSLCDMDINECVGVDCSGNGQCEDGVNTFSCMCDSGFTGQLCEINIDDCAEVDCMNGRCEDGVDYFTCICDLGFTGEFCDINIDDCIGVNCSGNGHCEDGVDSFTCICEPGFTGELCASTTSEGGSRSVGPNTGAIAGGVIGALVMVLLLIIITVIIVVLIVRRWRTREYTYKQERSTLPGDNPVYDIKAGGVSLNTRSSPQAASQNGEQQYTNTAMISLPDRDFENPLYGSPNAADTNNPTSNSAHTGTNGTTIIGSAEHDFDNPIYGAENTYEVPTTEDAPIYSTPDEPQHYEEPEHYEYLSETTTTNRQH